LTQPSSGTRAELDQALAVLGITAGSDPAAVLDSVWIGCQGSNAYLRVYRNNALGETTTVEIAITG